MAELMRLMIYSLFIADCVFDFASKKDEVASKVEELTKKFPLYE